MDFDTYKVSIPLLHGDMTERVTIAEADLQYLGCFATKDLG
jgi:hypothetical protein